MQGRQIRRVLATTTCAALFALAAPPPTLQQAATAALRGRTGTAVVVEVASGRVLAAERLDIAARRLALPGSTVKPFTLMALLRRGVVREDMPFACPIGLRIGNRRLDCVHGRLAHPIDGAGAVAYSCNNYFARFGARLRDQDLTDAFASSGMTRASGWARGEAAGSVVPVTGGAALQMKALGEEAVQVTPLGLLSAYRALAERKLRNDPDPGFAAAYRGLEQAVAFGSAQGAKVANLPAAGKTGTSRAQEGEWTHGWFVGVAPAERPRIAVIIFLERGRGSDAAALAGGILRAWAAQP